jgi:hypothetical protein
LARAVPIDRSAFVTDLTGFLARAAAAAGLEDCRCRLAIMSSAQFVDKSKAGEIKKNSECESVPLRQKPHEGQSTFIPRPAR